MTLFRVGTALGALLVLLFVAHLVRDPHRTHLPFGSTDLTSVQAKLDRLPADERQLVVDYVKRSGGDVLTARFADPDEPLTARTFGQAIALQKEFRIREAAGLVKQSAAEAQRAAQLEPLRRALSIELVTREIVPKSQLYAAPDPLQSPKQALPSDDPVLVTTWRVHNTTDFTIDEFSGGAHVHRAGTPFTYLGQLDECWIVENTPLSAGATVNVRCGNVNHGASSTDREYVGMAPAALAVEWIPKHIVFAGGKALDYPGD